MELEHKLAALGLVGKKARFYLAALELGDETVTRVARQAGLERTPAHALVDTLLGDCALYTSDAADE